jgi:ABC-type transport system involved in multi-copper enzyme maturation permease subunit
MFSRPIAVATIKHWLSAPLIWIAVGIVFFFTIGTSVFGLVLLKWPEFQVLSGNSGATFAIILGTGIIGRDLSSGVLPLVFARPISRANYVFSKWLTLSLTAIILSFAQCIVIHLFAFLLSPDAFSNEAFLAACADTLFVCFGFSAVMVLFSALKSGTFAGTGIWLLSLLVVAVMMQYGGREPIAVTADMQAGRVLAINLLNGLIPVASTVGTFLLSFFANKTSLLQICQNGVDWLNVTTYLSNVALALVLAIYLMNRRELTYATD